MGHNAATPHSAWAEDGSFHMSQVCFCCFYSKQKCSQDEIVKEKLFVKVLFTMSTLAQW